MNRTEDWQARSHEALYDQASQTVSYLTPDVLTRIGIDSAAISKWFSDEFMTRWNDFGVAFTAWKDPAERTPIKTETLKTAEKIFREVYREFYTGFLKNNRLVTNTDLVGMGFPVRSAGSKKPAPTPKTMVVVTVELLGPGRVAFHFRDAGSEKVAKPAGVHGMEFVYAILDHAPADWSELTTSTFDTRTPLPLDFPGDMRGKTLYYAARWENTRGEKGPWNTIESLIIP